MSGRNAILLDLYKLMALTRKLDAVIGAHDGHWHGLEGEEAVVAGTYYGLRRGDVVAPHYRGSVMAAYVKGADLRRLLAGILGKVTSYNRGRYRSDVCGPPEFNIIGLYSGALGPPLSYAAGAALAAKLDGKGNVAIGVFGDGTSSRGDCHEAMNLAASLTLPMVFVCQNNQIAISTRAASGVGGSIAARGAGYGMPGIEVDGNDVLAVHDQVQEAIARARAGGGPTLIEAVTYRVAGHFYSDAEDYRDAQEVARWRARDPIALFRAHLIASEVADPDLLQTIEEAAASQASAAMEQAKADPAPGADLLGVDAVYAPGAPS